MKGQKRTATFVSLWTLVGMGVAYSNAGAEAAVARSICARLATRMRASPATVLKDMSVPKMLPWIVKAASRPAAGDPVNRYLRNGNPFLQTIESLPGTDLSMASGTAGSGACLQTEFFELKEGRVFRSVGRPPIELDTLCSRQGTWGGLATILGQPSFIAYGPLDPSNMDSLLVIAPWDGKRWGHACPVSIRFRYRYAVTRLYCGASEAICGAARNVAAKVKRRYEVWSGNSSVFYEQGRSPPPFQFGGPPSARGQELVARARLIGMPPRTLAPGSNMHRAWLQQMIPQSTDYFPLTLDGNLYVGAASLARRTKLSRPYWLFILLQPPTARSRRLVPLAAFKVHRATSGVRSITATNASAPAGEMQSTKLPIF